MHPIAQSEPLPTVGLQMDREVSAKFDKMTDALHEVALEVRSLHGWAKDYQDHNSKDKTQIKKDIDRVETEFKSFRTYMYALIIGVLLATAGYLITTGQPWKHSIIQSAVAG